MSGSNRAYCNFSSGLQILSQNVENEITVRVAVELATIDQRQIDGRLNTTIGAIRHAGGTWAARERNTGRTGGGLAQASEPGLESLFVARRRTLRSRLSCYCSCQVPARPSRTNREYQERLPCVR